MIKVCFVISGLSYSGAEIVLERYLRNNSVVDPYFVIIYKNNDVINECTKRYGKDRVVCVGYVFNRFKIKIDLNFRINSSINSVSRNIKTVINKINPDIVYANNTIEAMLISKYIDDNKVIAVAHVHDMRASYKLKKKRNIISKALTKYNTLITVSNSTKESWSNLNMKVVYNGLDNKFIENNPKNYTGITKVGFVGSLIKRKGIDVLIDEIPKLSNAGYEINVVTKDQEGKYYNKIKKYEKKYNVKIYVNLNEIEIKKFMKKIDVLIVPSREDPLPTVVMEAMAVGTIVIGNNIASIKEMIGDDMLLFDSNSILEKLNYLKYMDKSSLNDISYKLLERCKKKFPDSLKKEIINGVLSSNITK